MQTAQRVCSLVCLGRVLWLGSPHFAQRYANAIAPLHEGLHPWPPHSVPLAWVLARQPSEALVAQCEAQVNALFASVPKMSKDV